ncbi:helix-turn-helix domain-containing protein [Prescottella equi]
MTDYLTVTEAARLLRKDRRTVQRMANTGRLTLAQKLPGATGAFLLIRNEVESLAAQRKASK